MPWKTLLFMASLFLVLPLNASSTCEKSYQKLLQDNQINVCIVYGYANQDSNIEVYDYELYDELIETLQRRCVGQSDRCGFQLRQSSGHYSYVHSSSHYSHLVKSVFTPTGQTAQVNLKIMRSATSPKDFGNVNGNTLLPTEEQEEQSQKSESFFFSGIKKSCEVMAYMGHSRYGWGPDFYPVRPEARKKDGSINSYQYKKFKIKKPSSRNKLFKALKNKSSSLQCLALFSCDNSTHWGQKLSRSTKELGLILSHDKVEFQNANAELLDLVGAIETMTCQETLQEKLSRYVGGIHFNGRCF